MKTKYTLATLLCFVVCGVAFGKMVKIDPAAGFNQRLATEAARTRSIRSDFKQVKYLEVFSEKIDSKGIFYFMKDDKIRLEYITPLDYLIVINGQKLKIVSDGKTNVVNLGSNAMMKEIKGMLAACMTGDLTRMTGSYDMVYFEDADSYLVSIKPRSKNVQAYLQEIHIYLEKKNMSVRKLRLQENATDYTEYQFTNTTYNTLTSDEKFIIR